MPSFHAISKLTGEGTFPPVGWVIVILEQAVTTLNPRRASDRSFARENPCNVMSTPAWGIGLTPTVRFPGQPRNVTFVSPDCRFHITRPSSVCETSLII